MEDDETAFADLKEFDILSMVKSLGECLNQENISFDDMVNVMRGHV